MQFEVRDRRGRGWFWVENEILDTFGAELGPYGLAVYAALCRFADQDGKCWPSQGTIAERTGMCRLKVNEEIAKLERLGLIGIERLKASRRVYYLVKVEG